MKWIGTAPGVLLALCLVLQPAPARALTDEEVFRDFRFNFINPGARALGLGGAFIAAADDATAAQANPAALHYVSKGEFFAEYRVVDSKTQVFTPSTTIGTIADPTPFFLELSSVNNPEKQDFPSFASFAYPFRIGRRRATFALSRQSVLNVETTLADPEAGAATSQRFSLPEYPVWVNSGLSCATDGDVEQYSVCTTVTGGLDAEIVHNNFGMSYSFLDDFSLGVTATYATLDIVSEVVNLTEDPRGFLQSSHPRLVDGAGVWEDARTRTSIDDGDAAWAYTIGLHWHPDKAFPGSASGLSPLRFGLVYRKGARFDVPETRSTFETGVGFVTDEVFTNTVREPDRFGLGVSWEISHRFTVAVDVERVEYTDLLENYRTGINPLTSSQTATSAFTSAVSFSVSDPEFTVDDATVVHAGVEFLSLNWSGWSYALRGGYYNAPDNRIRLDKVTVCEGADLTPPCPGTATAAEIEALLKDVFRGAEEVDHFTVGISVVTPIGLQLQFAGDLADDSDQYVASAIFRFGKVR